MPRESMSSLLNRARACDVCADALPHSPRPVLAAGPGSRIVIIGQAPGRRVHDSGVPWEDASGEQLRRWLAVDRATFYDVSKFALVPMGFCYPGPGPSGDLPPRPECAPLWHPPLLAAMRRRRLTLLIGQYAQQRYLVDRARRNLTETVRNFEAYLPELLPLPHPSPRNRFWLKANPWFEQELVPRLQELVAACLG